jgi:hypothetical protein
MRTWLSLAIAGLLVCGAAGGVPKPADLYVATNGSDAWSGRRPDVNDGRTDGPFASLERARDEIRKLKAGGGLGAGVTVHLRGGVYPLEKTFALTAEDSGTEAAPIVYRAYKEERVSLVGGREITGFRPYRDGILQADVKGMGLEALKPVTTDRATGDVPQFDLFFGGRRMDLARWPNHLSDSPRDGEWAYIASVPEAGSRERFSYFGKRPDRWARPEEAQVHLWPWYDWLDQYAGVKAVDREKGEIALATPADYELQPGRRFYVRNVFEELDAPGEWYLDRKEGALYFYPPKPLEGGKVFVSLLDTLVTLKDARYVTVRDVTLEDCRGNAVVITGGTHARVAGCVVRNTGMEGITITGGTANGAVGNDIYDTGRGGISLAGGDRTTLTPAGLYADNNHIHHFGQVLKTYQPAVSVSGVGNRVSHNLIHDAPHTAILLNGNDHVVEFNEIHHVCMEVSDAGAFYSGRDWTYRGNVIRYNRIHDIAGYGFQRIDRAKGQIEYGSPGAVQGIYLDDGMSGFHVYGNVLYRVGDMAVQVGGGRDNVVENNIFVDNRPAIGLDDRWPTYPWEEQNVKTLKAMPYQKPPWSTRYPELAKPMRNFRWPEGNRFVRNVAVAVTPRHEGFLAFRYAVPPDAAQIDNNLVWNGGAPVVVNANLLGKSNIGTIAWESWKQQGFDAHSVNANPRFVDAEHDNFQLRDDSPVYALGFKKIPMEQIGLYKDELRASWPVPRDRRREAMERATEAFPMPGFTPEPRALPTFMVRRAPGAVTVDGVIQPEEWDGAEPGKAMSLEQNLDGSPASPKSQAWLLYDDENLYISVRNEVDPNRPLKTGSAWGQDDAMEVALRNPSRKGNPPIMVLRGFANGNFRSSTEAGAPYDVVLRAEREVVYAAKAVDPGAWVAEWKIPFAILGINPDKHRRIDCNLTVRKTAGPLWLMWQGTGGNSWLLDHAGEIRLAD